MDKKTVIFISGSSGWWVLPWSQWPDIYLLCAGLPSVISMLTYFDSLILSV